MELALELGVPYVELSKSMTELEFVGWQRYAAKRMLPTRRIELYLAQIAYWVAKGAGVKDITVTDFLFSTEMPDAETADDLEAAIEEFQFRPRNVKKES